MLKKMGLVKADIKYSHVENRRALNPNLSIEDIIAGAKEIVNNPYHNRNERRSAAALIKRYCK